MSDNNKEYERRCMRCGEKLPTFINAHLNVCAYGCDSKRLQKVLDNCCSAEKGSEENE